ncbi:MAG TPA: NTP transferase domain-containing protein, partial [Dissulfurispiraceae bacterium]
MKQLLPLDGKPIIRWCLDSLLSSGLDDIAVVLGPRNAAMDEAIAGLPVTVAFNNSPGSDMSESVRAGLRAITPSSSGVL